MMNQNIALISVVDKRASAVISLHLLGVGVRARTRPMRTSHAISAFRLSYPLLSQNLMCIKEMRGSENNFVLEEDNFIFDFA